ncbi:MAG: hypothetical protein KGO49_00290 [Gammaproteobacteria bacterium]|nr:hypothetical protein [Gammaproteobacteria bacterium]
MSSLNKLIVSGLIILSVLVISLLFWLSPSNISKNDSTHTNAPSAAIEQPKVIVTTSTLDTQRTEKLIQGLETSPDGHLKITGKTRQSLDEFLGDQSKELSNDMMSSTKNQIHQKMKEPAATESITLLEHYATYKKELIKIDAVAPQTVQQMNDDNLMAGVKIQQISALRHEYLSPEIVQAFYGNDNSNAQYELARQRIMSINGLSDEQRQEELKALQDQLQKPVFN